MKKLLSIAISVFITLISFVYPNSAYAIEHPYIQQGDVVLIDIGERGYPMCTIGYVDKQKRNFLFAGHCSAGKIGAKVFTEDMKYIGTVVENYHNGQAYTDFAVVNIEQGMIGDNVYSHDRWVAPRDVQIGDTICSYGGNSKNTHCGKVIDKEYPNVIIGSPESDGIGGDSGAPAWIPGKGFVGVFSGATSQRTAFVYPDFYYGKIYIPTVSEVQKNIQNVINYYIQLLKKYIPYNVALSAL